MIFTKSGHHSYSLMIVSFLTLSKHTQVESRLHTAGANKISAHVDLIVTLQPNWIISSITKPGIRKDLEVIFPSTAQNEFFFPFLKILQLNKH